MRYAECLQAEGVHEGDVVGLCSENRIDFPCAMFGAIYLGATVAPLNLTYLESESSRVKWTDRYRYYIIVANSFKYRIINRAGGDKIMYI